MAKVKKTVNALADESASVDFALLPGGSAG
jgi:hypothetical protein